MVPASAEWKNYRGATEPTCNADDLFHETALCPRVPLRRLLIVGGVFLESSCREMYTGLDSPQLDVLPLSIDGPRVL